MDDEWTLDQSLAWVFWRDEDKAEKASNLFFEVFYDAKTNIKVDNDCHIDEALRAEYVSQLHKALCEERIISRGHRNGTNDRSLITAEEWRDREIALSRKGATAQPINGKGSFFDEILLPKTEVIAGFPIKGSAADLYPWLCEENLQRKVESATKYYLGNAPPECRHGWKSKAHSEIRKLKGMGAVPQGTIKKYTRYALVKYEEKEKGKKG